MNQTVDQKLKGCKQLCIQNLQKNTVQKNMVYLFLKQNKLHDNVKNITINQKQGVIKLEFIDFEKAKDFYDTMNFKGVILSRPFNIYFNLTLKQNEMQKYFLEGITDENQRKIFEAAKKIGICKLYTNYTLPTRGKIKSTGVLSFIRNHQLLENEIKQLTEDLKGLGVKIDKYVLNTDVKCSIKLTNFYKGNLTAQDQQITQDAINFIKSQYGKILKSEFTENINIKSKELNNKDGEVKIEKNVTALLQFKTTEQTMENFEILRKHLIKNEQVKVILFFHSDEINSYLALFTSNLVKPEGKSVKQFQDQLIQAFRNVNKNVIQVNVYPVVRNDTFIGRVYLKSEMDGKDFIVDYTSKRQHFVKYYKDRNNISFNINVDLKTLGKIKLQERNAKNIMIGVKQSQQTRKKNTTNNNNKFPMNQMPINIGPGKIPPFMHNSIPMSQNMSGMMNPNMNMGMGMGMNMGMGMGMGMPMGMPPPGMIPPISGIGGNAAGKLDLTIVKNKLLKQKDSLIKDNPVTSKKVIFPALKSCIDDLNIVPPFESGQLANAILEKESVQDILKMIESQQELKKVIKAYKQF